MLFLCCGSGKRERRVRQVSESVKKKMRDNDNALFLRKDSLEGPLAGEGRVVAVVARLQSSGIYPWIINKSTHFAPCPQIPSFFFARMKEPGPVSRAAAAHHPHGKRGVQGVELPWGPHPFFPTVELHGQ